MPKQCPHGSYASECKPCRALYMRLWARRRGLVTGKPVGPPAIDCPHGIHGMRRCRDCTNATRRRRRRALPIDLRRAEKLRYRNYVQQAARARRRQAAFRRFLAWLKEQPCVDCGGRFPSYCMDFDHRDPTQKRIGVSKVGTLSRLQDEILKCDLVCANCHRVRTYRTLRRGPRGEHWEAPRRARDIFTVPPPIHAICGACGVQLP
jgi:hypothetical protein